MKMQEVAVTRRVDREIAFHLLFELCFQPQEEVGALLERRLDAAALAQMAEEYAPYGEELTGQDRAYIEDVVQGVQQKLDMLDEQISRYAENWSRQRLSKTTLTLLRLALYEKDFVEDVPLGAAINEAVELAKQYESEDAAGFINGILGAVARGEKEE